MNKEYGFGVDIGGTTVKLGLFKVDGELLEQWEIKTRKDNKGSRILKDISKAIEDKIKDRDISKDKIIGIGMGVPGPVEDKGNVLRCVNLGWDIVNVVEVMEELTGLPIKVGNDANIAALGEMWLGGGKGCKNMIMVTLGTGVGGGIIVNGNILSGHNGAAGEIGHIKINNNETRGCGCGKKGCLEQYASATGIVNEAVRAVNSTNIESTLREVDELTAKEVFYEAKKGDKLAIKLVEEFGNRLGSVLATINCVCDPEVIVIGGGVSKAGEILIETVKKYFKEKAFHTSENTRFEFALLGNNAGIYGGVKLVLDQIKNN
ncbi:ROK family glucokinase [Clostridium intestinale]|uniref:ROK family glucokinase n=1 Tax=Clostridium intestinale TaxID=36845 RepID=UPI002DD6A055|nr:ROK family glucokinase [Clostridium intestinale]WRY51495.1 ROK family glucokinase [Clostridium intestinale]